MPQHGQQKARAMSGAWGPARDAHACSLALRDRKAPRLVSGVSFARGDPLLSLFITDQSRELGRNALQLIEGTLRLVPALILDGGCGRTHRLQPFVRVPEH
jgi:hypothetical protein